MTHHQIKAIVDEIGEKFFPKEYVAFFTSEITSTTGNPRYSLMVNSRFPWGPVELRKTRLTVRICTDFAKLGSECKEIGAPGRYLYDIVSNKNGWKNIYLTTSHLEGKTKVKDVVERLNCFKEYGWRINSPHFGTVMNIKDLPKEEREARVRQFVTAVFQEISPAQ